MQSNESRNKKRPELQLGSKKNVSTVILPQQETEKNGLNYFERVALEKRTYPLLDRPCEECAIIDGFYTPIADELLEETEEIQDANLERWFCHFHPDNACRGAYNYIHSMRTKRRRELENKR